MLGELVENPHLPPFDNKEYADDIRDRNREIRQQIDPDTNERIELLTRKQFDDLQKKIAKGLPRF